jgi:Fe-S-cluster containining protein
MVDAPETRRALRFACTSCGACCNRAPEVALSEAAALSDMFVFRLMFRLYDLPRTLAGYLASRAAADGSGAGSGAGESEEYYESKRLLAAFAARRYSARTRHGGKTVEYRRYVLVSALALDAGAGACTALSDGRCGIYERRPLACRTVPFHYSRPEASAERDLNAFVGTPGFGCDTGPGAPVVLEAGRIVDPGARRARGDALERAGDDRRWAEAILRRLNTGSTTYALPSLREIEADAPFGATTISMHVAWRIAAEAGLIGAEACAALIAAQAAVIDRALASARWTPAARETLGEMRAEYRELLNG